MKTLPWPFEAEKARPGYTVARNPRSGDWHLYSHAARSYVCAGNAQRQGEGWSRPDASDYESLVPTAKEVDQALFRTLFEAAP